MQITQYRRRAVGGFWDIFEDPQWQEPWLGLPEVPAPVLALVLVPMPLEDSGRLSVLACLLSLPFYPSDLTVISVSGCFLLLLSLPGLWFYPCHPFRVSLNSSTSAPGVRCSCRYFCSSPRVRETLPLSLARWVNRDFGGRSGAVTHTVSEVVIRDTFLIAAFFPRSLGKEAWFWMRGSKCGTTYLITLLLLSWSGLILSRKSQKSFHFFGLLYAF